MGRFKLRFTNFSMAAQAATEMLYPLGMISTMFMAPRQNVCGSTNQVVEDVGAHVLAHTQRCHAVCGEGRSTVM